jgi:hypothetical protein
VSDADGWLWLQFRSAREIGDLPGSVRYPLRAQAWILVLAAILLYALLPRRKPAKHDYRYARPSAVVVPDWLGFAMSACFLSMGMLVLNENARSLDGGWAWFAGIMGLMSACFLLLPAVANYYATWHLCILERGLSINRWGRVRDVAWDQIVSAAPYRGKANWVIGLLLIVAGRGPGMVGQGLLVMSNQEQGIELKLTTGRTLRIMANAFSGFAAVSDALRQRGLLQTEE